MEYKVLYAEANYGQREIDAVTKVLQEQRHNMVASTNVDEFQGKIAELFGKSYGVMCNSGSSANLLALASFWWIGLTNSVYMVSNSVFGGHNRVRSMSLSA